MTRIYPLFTFIISAMLLFLGIYVYRNNRSQYVNRIFLKLCLASSCWLLFYSIAYAVKTEHIAFILLKIGYCGVVFIPITVFHYTVEFVNVRRMKKAALYNYAFGLLCVAGIWSSSFIIRGVKQYFWGYYPIAGKLHPVFLAYFLLLITMSFMFLLYKYFFRQDQLTYLKKEQIKYIFMAIFIYNFASADFLPNYGISVYPFGYLPAFIFLLIISYTIVKYRLMEINVVITRIGIFLTLYTLVLGIPFWVGYYTNSWIWSTTFAVCLATLGPLIYRTLRRKAEDLLMSEQRRYQKILIQAASGMTQQHSLSKLLELIARIVKKAVKIEYVAVFLENKETEEYQLRSIRIDNHEQFYTAFKFTDTLIMFMKEHQEPFLYEEMPAELKKCFTFPVKVSLIVPSFYEESSVGFMILGEKQNKKTYSIDDINMFKILARQTSMSIENCIFVEEFSKAQEKVFAAEKLASIGGLAEGVAHQVNNRLNHFSMVSGELKFEIDAFVKGFQGNIDDVPGLRKTFDYFYKISDSLLSNVKKTDGILKGILNYARVEAKETLYSNFFLQEVVDLSLDLLKVKHGIQEFPLEIVKESSDVIYGIKSQIMESVYNLMDNAYEAILDRINTLSDEDLKIYTPSIKITVSQSPEKCILQFSDNGIGIKPTDKHKIFAPFFTTKSSTKSGTGIGMYVVRRMVEENHKGKIRFESEYGKGTQITVELPRKYTA